MNASSLNHEDDDDDQDNKEKLIPTKSSVEFNYSKYKEIRDELLLDVTKNSQEKLQNQEPAKIMEDADSANSIANSIKLFQNISDKMDHETELCFQSMNAKGPKLTDNNLLLRESLLKVSQLEDLLNDEKKNNLNKFNNIIEHYGTILVSAKKLQDHMKLEYDKMENKFQSIKDKIKSMQKNMISDFSTSVDTLIQNCKDKDFLYNQSHIDNKIFMPERDSPDADKQNIKTDTAAANEDLDAAAANEDLDAAAANEDLDAVNKEGINGNTNFQEYIRNTNPFCNRKTIAVIGPASSRVRFGNVDTNSTHKNQPSVNVDSKINYDSDTGFSKNARLKSILKK